MKQFFAILILALIFSTNHSFAQTTGNGKIKYGVKAGINVASYAWNKETKKEWESHGFAYKPLISFHIGGFADYAVSDVLSLQPGLLLSGKGFRETWVSDEEFFEEDGSGVFKETLMYLEIPLNVVYRTGKFFFGGGPYAGFAVSGKWKETYEADYGDGDIETDTESGNVVFSGEDAYRKRADFGVNFLAGYQVNEKIGLNVGYGLGLMNLANHKDPEDRKEFSMKNRVLSLSIAYTF